MSSHRLMAPMSGSRETVRSAMYASAVLSSSASCSSVSFSSTFVVVMVSSFFSLCLVLVLDRAITSVAALAQRPNLVVTGRERDRLVTVRLPVPQFEGLAARHLDERASAVAAKHNLAHQRVRVPAAVASKHDVRPPLQLARRLRVQLLDDQISVARVQVHDRLLG